MADEPRSGSVKKVLIVYSTTDGHTRTIAERLGRAVGQAGHEARVRPLGLHCTVQLSRFDTIVIGASVRYGRHRPAVYKFIQRNAKVLNDKPGAFFSVNLTARKPEKCRPEVNPYLTRFLKRIRWRPRACAVFAGKLDYPRYGFFDRNMIRLIMWITGGPTDPKAVVEFTDWRSVEMFGRRIAGLSDIGA